MDVVEVNQSGVTKSSTASSQSSSEVNKILFCLRAGDKKFQLISLRNKTFFSRALKRQQLASSRVQAEQQKVSPKVSKRKSREMFNLV